MYIKVYKICKSIDLLLPIPQPCTKDGQQQHDFIQRGLGHLANQVITRHGDLTRSRLSRLIEQDGIVSTVLRDIRQVIPQQREQKARKARKAQELI